MNLNNIINGGNFYSLARYHFPDDSPDKYQDKDIICCHRNNLMALFNVVRNHTNRYILITSFSDHESGKREFNSKPPCIKKWFSTNVTFEHQDLIPIPYGLESFNHKHQKVCGSDIPYLKDLDLQRLQNKSRIKDKIYVNFNLDVHSNRKNVKEILTKNGLAFSPNRMPNKDYWEDASNYLFIASPRGNGIDCHKTYEAILMGGIAIVEKNLIFNWAEGLPLIQIEDWNQVTLEFLNNWLDKHKYTQEKIFLPYWKNVIQEAQQKL